MVEIKDNNIVQDIDNRKYFENSFDWYANKYLLPVNEYSYVVILAIITIFCCFITGINIKALLSDDKETPIVIQREGDVKTFPVIHSISNSYKTPQESVASYLLSYYLMTREEYIFKDYDYKKNLKRLKRYSSKNVLREYQNFTSKFNPNSLLVKYKYHTNRLIEVNSVSFVKSYGSFKKAKVRFKSTEQSLGKKDVVQNWEALINFRLTNVDYISGNDVPLRFVINYYKVRPLKPGKG